MASVTIRILAATAALALPGQSGGQPLAAATPAASPPLAAAPAMPSPVDSFYAAHPATLVWLRDADSRAAATRLAALLRNAAIDGLENGPSLASAIEAALASGQPADDRTISAAFVAYVQRLKAPVRGFGYGDPALALSPPGAQAILAEAARAPSLAAHVESVTSVNPFYSALRSRALEQSAGADPRVRATLDRLRLVPARGRAIIVDSASARLWMIEDGRPVDSMKIVVGKKSQATPLLAGTIHYVTFNPYWHIPQDIARKRVAPVVLKRGVGYLKLARYQTVADFRDRKDEPIDPLSIDWKAVADGTAEVHVRQLSGPQNMMGRMKFGWVNDQGIFLHDTPAKHLFARDKRALSNGCVRLEHPDRLARWLLQREPDAPTGDSEVQVRLDSGVPIYVTYLTASVEGGELTFHPDVYGWDSGIAAPEPAPIASAAAAEP